MGRQIPVSFDDVPDAQLLPRGVYLMSVDSIDEAFSREKGSLMYKVTLVVEEPAQFAGVPQFDYYVIGNGDDPKAEQPATWLNSIGIKRFKRLTRATLVPYTSDMDELIARLTGQKFLATIEQEIDMNPKDPKYAGMKRNRIAAVNTIGTMAVGISGASDAPATLTAPPVISVQVQTGSVAAAKPTKVAPSATLACPYCSEPMSRAAYAQHRRDKHPDEE